MPADTPTHLNFTTPQSGGKDDADNGDAGDAGNRG